MSPPPFIEIRSVEKRFGEFLAVDGVSLDIGKGELFCLLGGSGCGKTTLLRMLAGFEMPSNGSILIGGEDVTRQDPTRRPVNLMFQSYALFPHMSVARNIAYGLVREGMAKTDIAARMKDMLRLVRLTDLAERKPHQLSGGQRQRVALARALAKRPKVLLLDEPLAALDKKLRQETQYELINIQETLGTTFVVVTHDQEEAMTLSDRIGVMDAGRLVQVGAPRDLYERPNSRYIADFLGTVSFFDGKVTNRLGDKLEVETNQGDGRLIVQMPAAPTEPANPAAQTEPTEPTAIQTADSVTVALRPERINLTRQKTSAVNSLSVTIEDMAFLGDHTDYRVRTSNGTLLKVVQSNHNRRGETFTWNDQAWVGFEPSDGTVLTQ